MFADDTKIWTVLRSYNDTITLQSDLDLLMTWSNTRDILKMYSSPYWQTLQFHLPSVRATILYLSTTHCERDLGVHVQDNLKWSNQCGKAAAKEVPY